MDTKTYLVKDYMRTDVHRLQPHSTVKEAVETMIKQKTNGLVIVDEDENVVGMLSSWDIIQYIVPDYLEADTHLAAFESGSTFASRVQEVQDHHIRNCMTDIVRTVHPDATLMRAITLLSEFHIRQLPVVDEHEKLIGYINRTDIKLVVGDILDIPRT